MTVRLSVTFSSFLLEDENLVSLHVRKNFYYHLGSFNQGGTYGDRSVVIHEHHFLKFHLCTLIGVDTVNK